MLAAAEAAESGVSAKQLPCTHRKHDVGFLGEFVSDGGLVLGCFAAGQHGSDGARLRFHTL